MPFPTTPLPAPGNFIYPESYDRLQAHMADAQQHQNAHVVLTIAALKALSVTGLSTDDTAYALGYYAEGDGGGGIFRYDPAATSLDNGGTIIKPTSITHPAPGRWLRDLEANLGTLNAKWFGAKGDGVADDTTAITNTIAAALDANKTAIKRIRVPIGQYKITSTITIIARGLIFEGDGCDGGNGATTNFLWFGNTTTPMFTLHVRHCQFKNFGIVPSQPLFTGMRLVHLSAQPFVPSQTLFEYIYFNKPGGGTQFTYCVELSATAAGSQDNNNDFHTFRYCHMCKYSEAGVFMDGTSQAFQTSFYECNLNGDETNGKYALKQSTARGGHFSAVNCSGGYNTVCDFLVSTSNGNPVLIDRWNSENSHRLVDNSNTFGANFNSIVIRDCRFETARWNADGQFIRWYYCGPVIIEGNYFGFLAGTGVVNANGAAPPPPRISLRSYGDANHQSSIRHMHNMYQYWNSTGTLGNLIAITAPGQWEIMDGGNIYNRANNDEVLRVNRQATIGI